ncbi:interleukin-17D-like [Lampetra fluviatilis]|uniref:IL-17B n=1 Tax=Lampetra planeri TaxID=7750 RepID=A0A0P0IAM7_LAMPL|nr:IL-17B [Lampetra planeri]
MAAPTCFMAASLLLLLCVAAWAVPRASASPLADGRCRAEVPDELLVKRLHAVPERLRLLEVARAAAAAGSGRGGHRHSCPRWTHGIGQKALTSERSLSPWTYRLNRKADRVPEVLPEAACLCAGCVEPHSGRETHSLVSVPVTAHVRVMYRERGSCEAGHARYEERWEEIAVGCTCVVPSLSGGGN